jgi:glutaconate CoA-transferase subunit A
MVEEAVIPSDPNRTNIPGLLVDAVVHEPFGANPTYAQGCYDRDNQFYLEWDRISRSEDATLACLDEWVYGVEDRSAYISELAAREPFIWSRLAPGEALSNLVNYGIYE